jgi:RecQ-mediated genome instability protein 1
MATTTLADLTSALLAQNLPPPHAAFLKPILTPSSASQRLPPLPALAATAKHRLLSSDLTSPNILDATRALAFPPNITDVKAVEKTLGWDMVVQVLDVEDVGRSKWEQIEALESERKGETTRGRHVIRVVAQEAEGEPSTASTQASNSTTSQQAAQNRSNGPFKVLLQDFKGVRAYGFELKRVEKIGYPGSGAGAMGIGCKILLKKGAKIARGMVLLEPSSTVVLGGKIEGLDKEWRERRENSLMEAVGDGKRRREEGENDGPD